MNLKEALTYLSENFSELHGKQQSIVGIAYTPDEEVDFHFIHPHIDEDPQQLDGEDYFTIFLSGSNIPGRAYGVDGNFVGSDIDLLIEELPAFAKGLNYQMYQLDESSLDSDAEYVLKEMFPELPDPDDFSIDAMHEFKEKAIALINKLNA